MAQLENLERLRRSQASLESLVYIALRHVIANHPNLSTIALDEDKSYPNVYFARLVEIDLRTCIEIHERETAFPSDGETDDELDKVLEHQHSRDFKADLGSKPFWRLIILRSSLELSKFTATWLWHHALADGASAFLFHETFLAGLNSAEANGSVDPIVRAPTEALLPPFEDLHTMSISWRFFGKAILGALLPSVFAKQPIKMWTGNPVPKDVTSLSRAHYRTLVLSKANTTASIFANLSGEDYERLKIEGPISMRPFLNIGEKQMTCAIGQYGFLHERSVSPMKHTANILQNFSWETARAVKSTLNAEVAKAGRDNPSALLKYVTSIPQLLVGKLGKPRNPSTEISNVGVWKNGADEKGDWSIGRMVFSQSPNLVTSAFAVSIVTGADMNAVLNFCWVEGAVENELMQNVINDLKTGVEELG
ncbi:carboxypeptidase s [Stemphylium lycopersici]|uniref:Carboxypeptidase s n=1 Tax=Stemphylium lycopersici TaxID=183478 RepID=A0A364N0I8_STELY|nr:carboxypeptidase s [Stemphylium lycopersici]RAR08736.1 carboxypeptidase s [Stemphylium lycopersici]